MAAALAVGDALGLGKGGCEEFTWVLEAHSLALINVMGHSLCVAPNEGALALARCPGAVASAATAFTLLHNSSKDSGYNSAHAQQVVHTATKKCLQVRREVQGGATPVLTACDPEEATQLWVFGSSGRLCSQGHCLGAHGGAA